MGTDPVPAGPRLELSQASGLFTLVYGADDKPESGTATLHKELPLIPAGVLQAARRTGYDRDLATGAQPSDGNRRTVFQRQGGRGLPVRSHRMRTETGSRWPFWPSVGWEVSSLSPPAMPVLGTRSAEGGCRPKISAEAACGRCNRAKGAQIPSPAQREGLERRRWTDVALEAADATGERQPLPQTGFIPPLWRCPCRVRTGHHRQEYSRRAGG